MLLEKVSLFNSKRDFFLFLTLSSFILFYSLLIEYSNYKNFTRFDTQLINATILKQYTKTKDTKTYQILKLKSEDGLNFYSSTKKSFPNNIGKKVKIEIWAGKINFYQYLTSFYTYSRVKHIYEKTTYKQDVNSFISSQHTNSQISNIYQALFTALPLTQSLQQTFSSLGVSHLLAISGFHLGVLSALLFFFIRAIYTFFQNRYFPYRNSKTDIFILISLFLLCYVLFLDSPPSILRAYGMLLVGFVLYDRGIKIISMLTLLISVILLLSFFPRLFFTLGFWLSVSGVFYIFLFLIHFKSLNKIWQFILVPFWVYLLMLPFSLVIFGNFSIYHPLSIIWTSLFSIFYPVSILLHILNFGNLFDSLLVNFMELNQNSKIVDLSFNWLLVQIILSLLSIYKKSFVYLLIFFDLLIFIYAINQVT